MAYRWTRDDELKRQTAQAKLRQAEKASNDSFEVRRSQLINELATKIQNHVQDDIDKLKQRKKFQNEHAVEIFRSAELSYSGADRYASITTDKDWHGVIVPDSVSTPESLCRHLFNQHTEPKFEDSKCSAKILLDQWKMYGIHY